MYRKYDRFARNLIDQEITILKLQKVGVSVRSITENDDVLLRRIRGAINEDEITKTLERSKLVKEDRAKLGYHLGRAPFGYDMDSDTHELIPNADTVTTITETSQAKYTHSGFYDLSAQVR